MGNGEVAQVLSEVSHVDVQIGDHYSEKILCYLAKLDTYTVIQEMDGYKHTTQRLIGKNVQPASTLPFAFNDDALSEISDEEQEELRKNALLEETNRLTDCRKTCR